MAKRKSKNVFLTVSIFAFLFSSILYLASNVVFKTYENHLTAQKQILQTQVDSYKMENEEAENEINVLASSKRVVNMTESSLKYQGQNVTAVTDK